MLAITIVIATAAGLLAGVARPAERASVRDGIYSDVQADRGRRTFVWICGDCHELAELTDRDAYLDEMSGRPLWDVFDYLWATMPEDLPGSLEADEYAAVLAYLLREYGLPAGPSELPIDRLELESIVMEPPDERG